MADKKKKPAGVLGVIFLVFSFLMFCWPGMLLFDKTGPLILGVPPMIFGTYLCVVVVVILMSILFALGVEE
jgi:hypothetical protein